MALLWLGLEPEPGEYVSEFQKYGIWFERVGICCGGHLECQLCFEP
jgi:hypothetical protein